MFGRGMVSVKKFGPAPEGSATPVIVVEYSSAAVPKTNPLGSPSFNVNLMSVVPSKVPFWLTTPKSICVNVYDGWAVPIQPLSPYFTFAAFDALKGVNQPLFGVFSKTILAWAADATPSIRTQARPRPHNLQFRIFFTS
jgi:hypothetical protein